MGEEARTLSKQKQFPKVLHSVEMTEYRGDQCRLMKDHAKSESVFSETCEICTYPRNREKRGMDKMPGISRGDMGGPLVAMKTVNGRKEAHCVYGVINSPQVEGSLSGSGVHSHVEVFKTLHRPVKYSGWGKHVRVSERYYDIEHMMYGNVEPPQYVEDKKPVNN